ncbi:MAG: hypothetical protein RJA22_218 [Verrucomicrobiota bacterium]
MSGISWTHGGPAGPGAEIWIQPGAWVRQSVGMCLLRCARLLLLTLALGAGVPVSLPAANTTARLLLSHEAARPGDTVTAAVELRMAPRWHTYWRNGGDSGAPTRIDWTLPAGVVAGDIQWPAPERYEKEGVVTYVYHGTVALLVPLRIEPGAAPGRHPIRAAVSWLECEDLCLTGEGEVSGTLEIGTVARPSSLAGTLEGAREKIPGPKPGPPAVAAWVGPAQGDQRVLRLTWAVGADTRAADFYPLASDEFVVATTNRQARMANGEATLERNVTLLGKQWPAEVGGLLVESGVDKSSRAYEVRVAVGGPGPAAAVGAPSVPAAGGAARSLLGVLGAAFVGGLILNLMPCVLPVLALKVLGVAQQSREAPGRVRLLALVYGAGVLVSFLIMAAIVIGVKSATGIASWGMQFQNPQFIVCLTVLVTLMALNLFGVFEVSAGGGVLDAAGALAAREGVAGSFFNGVVAVVLGTACTAPVLGGALGYAFAQSNGVIIVTLACVGLGLAFPYMLVSFFPPLRRFLPKPGAWMEKFKVALGFPMLATGVWLLAQLPGHYGSGGILWVGLFLVLLGVAAWVFGEFVQRGTRRRGLAGALALLLAAGGYAVALEAKLHWRSPAPPAAAGPVTADPQGIPWQPWSAEAVAAARAAGRPVLVDFTADWCLNCQVNQRTSLEIPSVRQRLQALNVVSLLGDFTKSNRLIAEELKRHGRAGVPLVLVYPRDPSRPPIVLPELLTPALVLDALEQAAK